MARNGLELIQGGGDTRGRIARPLVRELYEAFAPGVYARCLYLLKDRTRAEDAMQDVFAKVLKNEASFRAEASPQTWLMKIATHHCLNELRAERAPWRALFTRQQASRSEGASELEGIELRDSLRKHLARFDLETQQAVIHYHVDEMTLEEVARLLGRSIPTLRKRLEAFASAVAPELAP